VLKKDGEFWIWDAHMLPKSKMYAIRLKVDIHDKHTINTIYGVKAKDQSAESISNLLQKAGFEPETITNQKHWFMIKARAIRERP
jgi:hypothetical protein